MVLEIKSFQVLVNEFLKIEILLSLWNCGFKKTFFLNLPSFKCVSRSYIIE